MQVNRLIRTVAFSLIELMIVVAIMGVLASIAVPAYSDYVVRSKVSGMLASADVVQKAVSEYRMTNGNLTGIDPTSSRNTFTNLGVDDPTLLNYSLSSVNFTKLNDNAMSIVLCGSTTGQGISSTNVNDTVNLFITGTFYAAGMNWTCEYEGNSKYVPSSCRTAYQPGTFGAIVSACNPAIYNAPST